MFMKPGYKVQTPEDIQKTLKRKTIVNWIIFIAVLGLITVGILELITMSSK